MVPLLDEVVGMRAEARRHSCGRPCSVDAMAEEVAAGRPAASGRHRHADQSGAEQLPSNLVGFKILVVDDDETTLDYFSTALRMCGATVMTTTSAREALQALSRMMPDAILTDIAMPDGDGYWLLEQIRRHEDGEVRGVPVVAATAYSRQHSRSRTLAAGFTDYLQKPLDPEVLCRAMARAAGR